MNTDTSNSLPNTLAMVLAWLLLMCSVVASTLGACPPEESIRPCSCSTLRDSSGADFSILTCSGIMVEDELRNAVEATRGYPMFEIEIVECTLRFLPHDLFEGTTYEVLSIRNSSLISLSDSDIAFVGLEHQLHLIEVINCSYTANWDWGHLAHLEHLLEVHVVDSEMDDVAQGLASVQHIDVEAFYFQRNGIQVLADTVFASFTNLQRLMLDNNDIQELKRAMLPRPAGKLEILGLSYNNIKKLPVDMFVDMPKLKSLYLTGNPLSTINEMVFRPIWKQIHLFLFYATRLSCDCRISWLAKADNSRLFMHAECQSPASFKGRLLHSLMPAELIC